MIGHSFIYPKASSGAVRFRAPRRRSRERRNPYRPTELDLSLRSKPRVYITYDARRDERAVDQLVDRCLHLCQFKEDRSLRSADASFMPSSERMIDESDVTIVVIGPGTHELSAIDRIVFHTLEAGHGLLAISIPKLDDLHTHLPPRVADNVRSGFARWYQFPKAPGHVLQMIHEAIAADQSLVRNDRPPCAESVAESARR